MSKREILYQFYSKYWVDNLTESQVVAIYLRLKKRGKVN